ncbi:hypothetical protein DPMN_027248 [Dreissena polymorpha]|uniref:Uncharacterized protein n=1 Tax=Dreissena polymorpha TaxID=45954 RepID=A0A9D4LSI4_DREPO|nr:hypothetical protein DPMN_027248 [Dreissena polymorpha]
MFRLRRVSALLNSQCEAEYNQKDEYNTRSYQAMKVLQTFILVVMAMIHSEADEGDPCLKLTDCECGDVCVNELDTNCKGPEDACICKPGCVVFDLFINPGTTRSVYGNRCHCPTSPEHLIRPTRRLAACSRAAWRGQPDDTHAFVNNKKCFP